jgi:hypothetical protein
MEWYDKVNTPYCYAPSDPANLHKQWERSIEL